MNEVSEVVHGEHNTRGLGWGVEWSVRGCEEHSGRGWNGVSEVVENSLLIYNTCKCRAIYSFTLFTMSTNHACIPHITT